MTVFCGTATLRLRRDSRGVIGLCDSAGVYLPLTSLTIRESVGQFVTVEFTAYVSGWACDERPGVFVESSPMKLLRREDGTTGAVDSAGAVVSAMSVAPHEEKGCFTTVTILAFVAGWDDGPEAGA